jgi:hypothetical protein
MLLMLKLIFFFVYSKSCKRRLSQERHSGFGKDSANETADRLDEDGSQSMESGALTFIS